MGLTAQWIPKLTRTLQPPPISTPVRILLRSINQFTILAIPSPPYTPKGPMTITVNGTIITSEISGTITSFNVSGTCLSKNL